MLQARDGYLWLGTESGLARFDGIKFVVFDSQNTPELRSSYVHSLLEDDTQAVWIGTAAGLTRYRKSKFTAFTTEQGLPGNEVVALYLDGSRTVWALTTEGPAVYENGRFLGRRWNGVNPRDLSATAPGHAGQLWIGAGADLLTADEHGAVKSTSSLPLANVKIQALLEDHSGKLWIGTSKGLYVREAGRIRSVSLPDRLLSKQITALYEAEAGVVWAGTGRGAASFLGREARAVILPDQTANGPILSMLQDREGNIWMGTDSGGLTVLRDRKFKTYSGGTSALENQFRCVFQDRQGRIWAGTNGHGLRMFDGKKTVRLTTQNGLASDVILSLGESAKGELLVGTPDGMTIVHGTGVQILTSADGLPDDFIQSIYKDNVGSVWIGTRRGASHWTNGKLINFAQRDGLPSDFIGSILRQRNGQLWIGTSRGLAVWKNGKFAVRPWAGGSSEHIVTSLHEDEAGSLWIGTGESGLARLSGDTLFSFPARLGLPVAVVGIIEDANHRFWLSSPNGLFTVLQSELNAFVNGEARTISVVSYGTTDGLRVNSLTGTGQPAAWRDANNALWFATARGLVSVDAEHAKPRKMPPLVTMASVTVNDQTVTPPKAADLPPGLTRIAFEYDGLSFVAPQRVTFRYRLQGFDRDWVDSGTRRTAYYTNLAAGNYEFQVMARNIDGVWSTGPALLRFHVQPYFYQRWWFLFVLVLAAASLVYAGYRWRVHSVQIRFNALLEERARIAREIHDTLAQSLVAVALQLEITHRLMAHSVKSAGETLEQTRKLVQDSIAEARRSIWNLRSADSANHDLPSRLSKIVEHANANNFLNVKFKVTGAYRRLPAHTEDEVVRIGSEAVTNVVRHASASTLAVTLAFDDTKASLTIADDGKGFETGPRLEIPNGHYGIRGMLERAGKINATLIVDSAAGGGTKVRLELPIQ